jgi:hypothetical protein
MSSSDALRALSGLLARTPVRTFVIYPLGVIALELAIRRGQLVIVPWGALLLAWATAISARRTASRASRRRRSRHHRAA